MKYSYLGSSGVQVSQICLGTNVFGTQVSEEEAIKIIHKELDLGVNIIDTSDGYGQGKCEGIIGKALQGRRDDVIIATKAGNEFDVPINKSGTSRKNLLYRFNQSLERLKTDYIDIFYLHRFDDKTPLKESLSTLDYLVRNGAVRYVACSNFTAAQIEQAKGVCEEFGYEKFIVAQPPYNIINRAIEAELVPLCLKEKIGIMPYSPLMGGFLSGKYVQNTPPPQNSRGAAIPNYFSRNTTATNFDILDKLRAIANEASVPMIQLALGWILKKDGITSVIVGASRENQVSDTLAMVEVGISEDVARKVDAVTAPSRH